ncbi:TRAP transporter small permease [Thermodesulfobacteriota bacterium]
MKKFSQIIEWITNYGMILGSVITVAVMLLIVANVCIRFFGGVIGGTYELVEIFICASVAFALAYCGLVDGHVSVHILLDRLPPRVRFISGIITKSLGILIWMIMFYFSIKVLQLKYITDERTDVLLISYTPFRIIWVFGLLLLSVIIFIKLWKHWREGVQK